MNQFQQINYLMIETNSSCNLKCTWCNRERLVAEGHRAPKNATQAEFKKMLDVFKNCPIDTIKLEGISEPFLHPQFDQMAQELKNYFPKAFVIVATNCQYNAERTRLFQTIPYIDMLYLSVDGVGKTFEKYRVGASYQKLLDTFNAIKLHVPKNVRKQKLFINFTATEENFRELPEIYKLAQSFDLAGVRINIVQNWNEDEDNTHSEISSEFKATLIKYKSDVKGVPGWELNECFWPYTGIVVDVFGNFRQCIINTSQKPLGNIFKDNVEEIFNHGAHYSKTRELLAKKCAPDACKTCDYHHQADTLKEIFGGKHIHNKPRAFLDVTQVK